MSSTTTFSSTARWGQSATYVPSARTVYFVGGAVSANSSRISSDVVLLDLTQTTPSLQDGPTTSLGAVAFHTLSLATSTSSSSSWSEQLIVIGGMTSSCASNPVVYTLDIKSGQTTEEVKEAEWEGENVAVVRRRMGGSAWLEKEGSDGGEVLVVGGMADGYVCASGTYAYPAYDVLDMPMTSSSFQDTLGISAASSTTSATLAVADFSLSKLSNNTLILAGGHDIEGDLMSFDKIGMFTQDDGWMVMSTSGDMPASRVGHSMVTHPTLDLLILFGGSGDEEGEVNPLSDVFLLNTTSWVWTSPSNVQPSGFAARAWHSSVMIPSGVMVSAFGMGDDTTVLSDMAYLDATSTDPSSWSWTTSWNASWTPTETSSASANAAAKKETEIKSIVPSVLIFLLIIVPVAVWFGRRHVKQQRRRQLARHFEMHDEDENVGRGGDSNGVGAHGSTFGNLVNPLNSFVAAVSRRRSSSFSSAANFGQFKPFGGVRMQDDGSEKRSGFIGSIKDTFEDLKARAQGGKGSSSARNPFTDSAREMSQVGGRGVVGEGGDRVQWEEIDFGLGKVDEGRRSSNVGGGGSIRHVTFGDRSRTSTPTPTTPKMVPVSAMKNRPSVPSLVVVPPTTDDHGHPVVPSPTRNSMISNAGDSPVREINYPVMQPRSPAQTSSDQAGWDQLADSLASKPVFRSEDPFSDNAASGDYRRASHTIQTTGVPVLPTLDFQQRRTPSNPPVNNAGGASTLPARKWNETAAFRRLSEGGNGGQSGFMSGSARSTSQPMSNHNGRDLTSSATGVTFNDKLSNMVRSVSGSSPGYVSSLTPAPPTLVTRRGSTTSTSDPANRLSNPPLFPPPSSPLPAPSHTASDFSPAPISTQASYTGTARELTMAKRGSGDSALRVVNITPDPSAAGAADVGEGEGGQQYPWGGNSLGRAM